MTPLHLRNARLRLTLLPSLGCSWRSLERKRGKRWLSLLHPFPDLPGIRKRPLNVGAFLMAPWCNRISPPILPFQKKRYPLRKNLEDGSAIHGDVFSRPWRVRWLSADSMEAVLDSRGLTDFNFPGDLRFRYRVQLAGQAVRSSLFIRNVGTRTFPVGMGFHPFFRKSLMGKTARLKLPAGRAYDGGPLPRRLNVVQSSTDLGAERHLRKFFVDRAYTNLEGPARLTWDGIAEVVLQCSPAFTHSYVYAPDKHGGKKAAFVCTEPMTQAPNAHRAFPETLKLLKPGEEWGAAWSLEVRV